MYIHFNGNPCSKNIGDCVIRAISIVTGYSRHKIYAGLCLQGFPCTIWGNSNAVWADYLLYLGFRRYMVYGKQTVEDFSKVHPHSRDDSRDSMIHELREIMQDAPDEHTKKRFQSFIRELENA